MCSFYEMSCISTKLCLLLQNYGEVKYKIIISAASKSSNLLKSSPTQSNFLTQSISLRPNIIHWCEFGNTSATFNFLSAVFIGRGFRLVFCIIHEVGCALDANPCLRFNLACATVTRIIIARLFSFGCSARSCFLPDVYLCSRSCTENVDCVRYEYVMLLQVIFVSPVITQRENIACFTFWMWYELISVCRAQRISKVL